MADRQPGLGTDYECLLSLVDAANREPESAPGLSATQVRGAPTREACFPRKPGKKAARPGMPAKRGAQRPIGCWLTQPYSRGSAVRALMPLQPSTEVDDDKCEMATCRALAVWQLETGIGGFAGTPQVRR